MILKKQPMLLVNHKFNIKHFKIIIPAYFLFLPLFMLSQQDDCGFNDISDKKIEKIPWYNNNQYLIDILDSHNYYTENFDLNNAIYRIPVKFWVYRDRNKITGGASMLELKYMMINLNMYNISNNSGIVYYMRPDVIFINKGRHKKMGYYAEAMWQTIIHSEKGCVNVFVVDDLIKKKLFGHKSYLKGTYNTITKAVIVKRNSSATTLSHEVGHFLGLLHPHRNYKKGKCKQEAVSRKRKFKGCLKKGLICETNGDAICDTPAEPNLIDLTDSDCNYIGNKTDLWGDKYEPNTDNIMSYPKFRKCRHKFTPGQIAVMLHTAKEINIKQWKAKENQRYLFDEFEPDNTRETAGKINNGIAQRHTFHKTFMGKNNKDDNSDVDWIKFRLNEYLTPKIEIQTKPGDLYDPDTKIYLYNQDGRIIASDDNSGFNNYSKISVTNLKKGWYFVKIIRQNQINVNSVSDYDIIVWF